MRKRNMKIKILLVILLTISLGYALLTVNLKIEGLGNINAMNWDVHWGNAQVTEGSVTDVGPSVDGPRTTATFSFNLKFPGEFYEFIIDAVNSGGKDAMIQTIDNKIYEEDGETVATLPSYIHYSFTYTNGTAIAPNQKLPANSKKQYKVRIEYDSNTLDSPSEDLNYIAEFKVTYKEADNNAVNVDDGRIHLLDSEIIELTDQQGKNKQQYLLLGEETVNGVPSYVMVARHNVSIFATMPGSVQFLQYDENAAAKKLGVNYFYTDENTSDGYGDYNGYDNCTYTLNYYDYNDSIEYLYDYLETTTENYDYSNICYFHKETDTGVEYCFERGYDGLPEDEDEYYSYSSGMAFSVASYVFARGIANSLPTVVNKHKEKLESMGINVTSARLMTYEEADRIKDDLKESDECFWLGSGRDGSLFYFCGFNNNAYMDTGSSEYAHENGTDIGIGLRPVITIPKSAVH